MMKVIVTHNSNSISFEVEKNLPEHEAFEVVRAFTVSAFENLPEPLVYTLAGGEESFRMQDPKDWKEGIQKHFQRSVVCLNVFDPNTESDGESDSYVVLTEDGSDQKTEEKKEEPVKDTIQQTEEPEEEEPVIEDAEEELDDKVVEEPQSEAAEQAAEQEGLNPQSMKQRIMQFIVEIGSEAVQNIVAVAHSLITEGADLGDAIRTAIATSEKAANHPLTQDLLAIMDVYVQKFQNQCNWQPILAQFNVEHIVALIPGIVEALTRSLEGADRVELDMGPLMSQFCPMLRGMCQNIPHGQERVFQANPMNPFAVFEEARQNLAAEQEQREQASQEENRVVHRGVVCDGCEMSPIVGVRYKSVLRADYDLCEECEKTHDPKDPLIKIKTPMEDMELLPGLGEFRRAAVGGRCGRGRRNWCRRGRGGRGRGRGCRMMKRMFESMKKHCEENGGCPWKKGSCDWKKNCGWKKDCNWKNSCESQAVPQDRRDPARDIAEKKAELQSKKQEVKEQKKELKEKKKEMKKLKHEMKKLKKEAKASLKKDKYDSEVVSHLETEETSTQKAGTCVLHQWKVKNTGTEAWTGDVLAMFQKGNQSLVADGFEVLDVGQVAPGHVCYLPLMLNVPELPGTYSAIYRMTDGSGRQFGEVLRVIIEVPEEEPPKYEEAKKMSAPSAPAFSSVPGSNIPKTIDDVPEEVPEAPVEEVKEVPEEVFEYAIELQMLKDMGLENDEETMKSVLVVTKGDIAQAIEMLF